MLPLDRDSQISPDSHSKPWRRFLGRSRFVTLHFSFFTYGLFALAGCEQPATQLRLMDDVERTDTSVVVFFADGIAHDRFQALLADGRLPNIQRQFVEGGVGVENAIVSLPPITYASAVTILTGCFPGHHGVLGNRWFDRDQFLLRDYGSATTYRNVNADFDRRTLFEILNDRFTVSVQTHTDRGADVIIDNWITSGLDWLNGNYQGVDARIGQCATEVVDIANGKGCWPSVYFNYFPGLDEIGHRFGADSAEYASALETVDTAIGKIVATCEQVSGAENTFYVLLTDHSHVVCSNEHALDVAEWLESHADRKVHTGAVQNQWRPMRRLALEKADTVVTVDAGRRATIHIRGDSNWHEPPSAAAIETIYHTLVGSNGLVTTGAVVAACRRGEGDSAICDMQGTIFTIQRKRSSDGTMYRCLPANETPLASDGAWHDAQTWLELSAGGPFPDFVPQIVEMFDSPRAGDIVLFAGGDWTFDATYPGAHGSCLARDMRVPMYFAGPNLPAGATIPTARLADIMPTILDLLNETSRLQEEPPIDGTSLLPALTSVDRIE